MRTAVLINAKAGTVRERGADALAGDIRAAFAEAGHDVAVDACEPADMDDAIEAAAARTDIDVIVAGGGDGTLSAAAAMLAGRDVALGCLPLGTMNLYCRAIGVPMNLEEAIASLARGRIESADMGEVNGRPFLHHVSIGVQPAIVETRNKEEYSGKLGKRWATLKTFFRELRSPTTVSVELSWPDARRRFTVPAVMITSNPILSDVPGIRQSQADHRLGVYVCASVEWGDLVQIGTTLILSDLAKADCLESFELPAVDIHRQRHARKGFRASVDGEIVHFDSPLSVSCRENALRLLLPEQPARP